MLNFKVTHKTLWKDGMLGFVFVVTTISRLIYFTLPIFLITWVLSFTPPNGTDLIGSAYSHTPEAVDRFHKAMMIGLILSFILTPLFGYMTDKFSFEL